MSETAELDTDELRAELDRIKDAMGLRERYPSQFRLWLVYGLLVPVAAFTSQAVVTFDLPGWLHPVAWAVTMTAAGFYQPGDGEASWATEGKPRIGRQMLFVGAYVVVVFGILAAVSVPAAVGTAAVFAAFVGLVGVAYLVMAESLRAYYVRRRDRRVLLAGGAWMLLFAAAMPTVPALRTWGYAAFGVLYGAFALGAYRLLAPTG